MKNLARITFLWCLGNFILLGSLGSADHGANFRCHGINYNIRAGPDWAPPESKCKSDEVIQRELALLKGVTDRIRLYSLTDCDQATRVLPAAAAAGLQVALGLWVSDDPAVFEAEKNQLDALLQNTDGLINDKDIIGIHVGSEAIYRKEVTADENIALMNQVKTLCADRGLSVPITIADIGDVYMANPQLIEAVDVVSANAFPFWEKIDVDEAADHFLKRMEPLFSMAAEQDKRVVISETGWASNGLNVNASDATPENAAKYFHDFYHMAEEHEWEYFYFAAFDEEWKVATSHENNTVEAYFGLFDDQGTLKPEIAALSWEETAPTPSSTPSVCPVRPLTRPPRRIPTAQH